MSNKVPKHQPSLRSTYAQRAEAAAHEAAAGERRRRRIAVVVVAVLALVGVAATTALLLGRGDDEAVAHSEASVRLGCSSCHTTDGRRSEGPTWQGLAGSTVSLADGTTVVADDAYLRRAITDPQAEIVAGFAPGMPQQEISDEDLDALVAFIRSLA
ncbi:MAG: cytochrome c [Acidimicrobiales bacterium]|nr:cytochrome c [Acidimicrobiales bacterium]HRW38250.1 cytochrome c [Aquihabitans sp.]